MRFDFAINKLEIIGTMGQSLGHRQACCAAARWWTDKLRSTKEGYTLWLTSPNDHIQEFKWVLWPKHLKSVQLKKQKKKEKSRVWKQDFSRVQEFILWAIILNLIIWNTHRPVNTEGDEIKILLS